MANLQTTQSAILAALTILDEPLQIALPANISIYQSAYFVRLYNALATNFPSLFNYLTDEEFSDLASHYIKNNPSQHFNLQYYGSNMVDFICANNYSAHYSAFCLFDSLVQEVAALCPAHHSLTLDNFQSIAANYGDKIMIQLSPTTKLITLNFNVLDIVAKNYSVELLSTDEQIVIFQKEFKVYHKKLALKEYETLSKCRIPRKFNDFWADVEFQFADAGIKLLQQWLSDQLLCYSIIET